MTTSQRSGSEDLLLGRYRPTAVLKAAAATTVLARDEQSGRSVVVKTAASKRAGREGLLLEHEAAVLRAIDSPWIAPLVDHAWTDGSFSLVTTYIEGVALDRRLGRPLEVGDVVVLGCCLMRALRDAHDAGVIHRDVKPSNIITNDGGAIETAVLVDFGLARNDEFAPIVRDVPVGTALYMAPEQSGLLDDAVDERSDLYSAGVVLYECLAGRPPFTGERIGEVLRQHVTAKPQDLRELGVDLPRALDELVNRLLAKDPRDRYQSADGVLADLEDIRAALARGESEPPIVVGLRDRRKSLAEPAFVGRASELATLEAELERARAGHGRVVLVEAESGGGKTRLMKEFAQRSALAGADVYRGQGIDQGAQRPFEVLHGVGQALVDARDDATTLERISGALGDRIEAACGALPELALLFDVEIGPAGPEEFGQQRAIEALDALITSLGTSTTPAILVLDDCQWADELTLKLLARWNRGEGSRNVMVAVAFRSEEVGPGHVLREIEDPIRLELEPLSTTEVRQLVESMAGPVPEAAIGVVVELAEGSPFMASAVVRGLVESGALVFEGGGWTAVPDALNEASASRRAGTFLARRLSLVSECTLRLLQAGAVLGKEFDLDLATALMSRCESDSVQLVSEARRRHMIWCRTSRCAFVHDKIREAVLDSIPADERRELHRRAARRIQSMDPDRAFEIAFHLDAGGESERALPFALGAAELARERNALASSQQNYEIAERGSRATKGPTRLRVLEGLADVLVLRGRYDEAAERFAEAETVVADPPARARVQGKVGQLLLKRGDVKESAVAIERALATLGRKTPRSFATLIVRLVWEVAVQAVHSIFPGRVRPGREDGREADLLAVQLYDFLSYAYWFHKGPLPALWAHSRGLNLAERYPGTRELAKSCSTDVAAYSIIVPAFFARTVRFAERSLELWRELGDVWGEGQAMHFYGISLYSVGRYEECIAKMREATRLLEKSGDRWEANTATWHMAYANYRLGDRETAIDIARHVHRTGVEIGDAQARGISLAVWSKASDGAIPADLVAGELERGADDTHTSAEVCMAEGVRLLGIGDPPAAAGRFELGVREMRRRKVLQIYVASIFAWRAQALRTQVESSSLYDRRGGRALGRRWRRAARAASMVSHLYPIDRAHSLREAALHAAAAGKSRRARRAFDRSLASAESLGARRERAQTLIARGTVGLAFDWPGAESDLAAGREELAALDSRSEAPETVTVSLLDRFDSLLEEGRHIATALSKDSVYIAVRNAALNLLRAERCMVLEVRGDDDQSTLTPVSGSGGDFGTSVAWRAVREGAPVVVSEEDAIGEVSESLVLAGVRSSLAAPISVRGRIAACLYVDHKGVGSLFGADEQRIAGFLSAVAGAALENAEGFAEVGELTRTLENRVAERTTELADTNTRLETTLEDLRRLDQLKNEFMAMAAHDLRTPMTVIAGFASALREQWGLFDEAQKMDFLDRINNNTRRLSEFVENLLHFARIESGELSYDLQPLDLGALASRTAEEQTSADGSHPITVRVADGLPFALGDEQRTWQVLTNLVSNALKFSPPAGRVSVDVAHHGDMIEVRVTDEGIGITPEDQAKLFRKFARIEAAGGVKGPLGTGLGLYICRSIVESQGGRIWVESLAGHGSTFAFTLPVAGTATDGAA